MAGPAYAPQPPPYAAIAANVLGFGLFVPGIGILLSLVSVGILCVWYAVIGWQLLHIEATERESGESSGLTDRPQVADGRIAV